VIRLDNAFLERRLQRLARERGQTVDRTAEELLTEAVTERLHIREKFRAAARSVDQMKASHG
jgi:predicted transcriptional regulator